MGPETHLMNSQRHLLIQEFTLQAGDEWTSATNCWWVLNVSRGASYWLGLHQARSFDAGEAVVIAPGVHAIIRASQLTEVILRGFAFSPENLFGFFTLSEREIFETELTATSESIRFLPSTHPVARRLAALAPADPAGWALGQRAEALSIIAAAFDGMTPAHGPPDPVGTSASQRFRQLVAELSELEMINYTPAELARLCGCGIHHFHRLFREHFGTPARDLQVRLRLLKACQLLRDTDESVAVITRSCGFRNVNRFERLFETRFGMALSEWRQKERAPECAETVIKRSASSEAKAVRDSGNGTIHPD